MTLDALNVLRQSLGLRPVVWDAGLAASATARAAQVEAGGIPMITGLVEMKLSQLCGRQVTQ